MTYYSQHDPQYGPDAAPITRVVCDPCAKAGEVPFDPSEWCGIVGTGQHPPWRWVPYAMGRSCAACGHGT